MTISMDDAIAFRHAANYIIESCGTFTNEEMQEFVTFVDTLQPETLMKAFEPAKKFAQFLIEVRSETKA